MIHKVQKKSADSCFAHPGLASFIFTSNVPSIVEPTSCRRHAFTLSTRYSSLALKYVCKLKAPACSSREAGIAGELNLALTGKESRRFPVPATDRFFKDPGTVQLPAIPLKGQTVSLAGKGDHLRKNPLGSRADQFPTASLRGRSSRLPVPPGYSLTGRGPSTPGPLRAVLGPEAEPQPGPPVPTHLTGPRCSTPSPWRAGSRRGVSATRAAPVTSFLAE